MTTQLQFCQRERHLVSSYLRVGYNFVNRCTFRLEHLFELDEPMFYDAFYADNDGELKPLPVRVANYIQTQPQVRARTRSAPERLPALCCAWRRW